MHQSGLFKCVLPLLFSFFVVSSFSQEIAVTHCQGACPQYDSSLSANRSNIVIHHLYAAAINNDTGIADWVAYHLSRDSVGVASLLSREWQADNLLKFSDAAELLELGSSGVSLAEVSTPPSPYSGFVARNKEEDKRVRLAPLTSFANTPYWSELNNISNMVSMPKNLRLGAWLQLEQSLNQLVETAEDLYVISGPLYLIKQALSTSLQSAEFGPTAYYKIVLSNEEMATFVFPENLKRYESFCGLRMELEEVERMTGLEFFPARVYGESDRLLDDLGCE